MRECTEVCGGRVRYKRVEEPATREYVIHNLTYCDWDSISLVNFSPNSASCDNQKVTNLTDVYSIVTDTNAFSLLLIDKNAWCNRLTVNDKTTCICA